MGPAAPNPAAGTRAGGPSPRSVPARRARPDPYRGDRAAWGIGAPQAREPGGPGEALASERGISAWWESSSSACVAAGRFHCSVWSSSSSTKPRDCATNRPDHSNNREFRPPSIASGKPTGGLGCPRGSDSVSWFIRTGARNQQCRAAAGLARRLIPELTCVDAAGLF